MIKMRGLRAALIFPILLTAPVLAHAVPMHHPRNLAIPNSVPVEPRGIETAPVFVKVIPSPKTAVEASHEQSEKDKAAATETRLADLTADLARYTEKLFYATAFLALLTAGLLVLGFIQSNDAKRSIAASETAANAARDQVRLGREEYIASYRPKLSVRHVALGTPEKPFPTNPGIGDDIAGSLVVVNNGGTKATIISSRYLIYFRDTQDGLPMMSPLDEKWLELIEPDSVFEVAESCAIAITGKVAIANPRGSFIQLGSTYATVYVMGQIQYRDEADNERFMGFCRKWHGEGTFTPVIEADYEYAE